MLETRNGCHSYDKTVEDFLKDKKDKSGMEERCQESTSDLSSGERSDVSWRESRGDTGKNSMNKKGKS